MLLATECPICERPGPAPCDACARAFGGAPSLAAPAEVDACRALVAYAGRGRDLVAALKFRNRRSVVPWLAERLAAEVVDCGAEVVTWAPTSALRRRRRGFDQSELLARRTARAAAVPFANCLVRLPGPSQTGRTRLERQCGPTFDARRGVAHAVHGRTVALVDDVVTSGATMSRAAEVLRHAGAASVVGIAVARTPNVWR
jgi:ComF family protein